jgi:hypothetical protein
MPCRHVPEQDSVRLQSCDLTEEKQDATPLCPLPRDVCLDKEEIRSHCAETAEGGDEAELADLFAQCEIEWRGRGMAPSPHIMKRVFRW